MISIMGSASAIKSRPGVAVKNRFSDAFLDDIIHSSNEAFRTGWEPALPPTKCFEGACRFLFELHRDVRPQAAGAQNLRRPYALAIGAVKLKRMHTLSASSQFVRNAANAGDERIKHRHRRGEGIPSEEGHFKDRRADRHSAWPSCNTEPGA